MRRNAGIRCGVAVASLLALCLSAPVARSQAATTAPDSAATIRMTSPTRKPAVAKASSVASRPRGAKTAKKAPTTATTAKTGAPKPGNHVATKSSPDSLAGPRRLDDINIQGEIPVPQVLFITARDQRRFLDFQHRRYLKNSQRIGETTVLPSWIAVAPDTQKQESPR